MRAHDAFKGAHAPITYAFKPWQFTGAEDLNSSPLLTNFTLHEKPVVHKPECVCVLLSASLIRRRQEMTLCHSQHTVQHEPINHLLLVGGDALTAAVVLSMRST
jgi:hypothetical protein